MKGQRQAVKIRAAKWIVSGFIRTANARTRRVKVSNKLRGFKSNCARAVATSGVERGVFVDAWQRPEVIFLHAHKFIIYIIIINSWPSWMVLFPLGIIPPWSSVQSLFRSQRILCSITSRSVLRHDQGRGSALPRPKKWSTLTLNSLSMNRWKRQGGSISSPSTKWPCATSGTSV